MVTIALSAEACEAIAGEKPDPAAYDTRVAAFRSSWRGPPRRSAA
jgi:hypothetical protein